MAELAASIGRSHSSDTKTENPVSILRWLLLFFGFLIFYFVSNLFGLSSSSFSDYPFGSDVPRYLNERGNAQLHPLVAFLLSGWRFFLRTMHLPETPAFIKAPFAAAGAVNVVLATAAFQTIFQSHRSFLYGCCYGSALSIWYFSSTPESYVISAMMYSGYLLCFLHSTRFGITASNAIGAAVFLFLGMLNDLSAVLLTVVPLVYYGMRALREPAVRAAAGAQTALIALYLGIAAVTTDFIGRHVTMFGKYTPLSLSPDTFDIGYKGSVVEPFLNFFFFSIGAPSPTVTYATAKFPSYVGFFEPSILTYASHPFSVTFASAYFALMSFIRLRYVSRMLVAVVAFVAIRFALVVAFNPGEAILYTPVSTLSLLLILFLFLEKSQFPYKSTFATILFISVVLTNSRFML